MDKLIKDGKVAIIYSHDYGGGWSTWNGYNEEMIFDPVIAQAIIDEKTEAEIYDIAVERYPEAYHGGANSLKVLWVEKDTLFRVTEYDGAEGIEVFTEESYYRA